MKAKVMPRSALTPTRDPLLDDTRLQRSWAILKRWLLAVVVVLALATVGSALNAWGKTLTIESQARSLSERDGEITRLQRDLALRRAAGSCSTLFYLVEADDARNAGEKLLLASMRIAEAANLSLYPNPLPPLEVPK